MHRLKYVLLFLVIAIVVAQFIRPAMTNPAVDPARTIGRSTAVPPAVDATLRRACYDCHSSETRWPWYAKVAPVSWLLAHDVNDGRGELSFSEFASYPKRKAARKMHEACNEIRQGDMPPELYLPMHPDAKLSDADKQMLCNWFGTEEARINASMTPAERAQQPAKRVSE